MNDGDYLTEDTDGDRTDEGGVLETTDIDADEMLDGEVDAGGAAAIDHRNE